MIDFLDTNALLLQAAASGNVAQLEALLALGANPNFANVFGQTALHLAAKMDRVAAIEYLLQNGADLYLADNTGITPFILLCANAVRRSILTAFLPAFLAHSISNSSSSSSSVSDDFPDRRHLRGLSCLDDSIDVPKRARR